MSAGELSKYLPRPAVAEVERLLGTLRQRIYKAVDDGALIDIEFERHQLSGLLELTSELEAKRPLWTCRITVSEPVDVPSDLRVSRGS